MPHSSPSKSRKLEVSWHAGTDGTVQPERPVTYTGFATIIQRTRPAFDLRNNQFLYVLLKEASFSSFRKLSVERWKVRHGQYISGMVGTVVNWCLYVHWVPLPTIIRNTPTWNWQKSLLFFGHKWGIPLCQLPNAWKRCYHSVTSVFPDYYRSQYGWKSTLPENYRRNYLLACYWSPVCCVKGSSFTLTNSLPVCAPPIHFPTMNHTFAEPNGLKRIIDLLESRTATIYYSDEYWKGPTPWTNKGSFDLIRQFMQLEGQRHYSHTRPSVRNCLIKQFPWRNTELLFEADIKENELTFPINCKKEGVAQNMNACFWWKKIILQE